MDKEFLILWLGVLLTICIIVSCVTGYNIYTNKLIAQAKDPMAASCAMASTTVLCPQWLQKEKP